MKRHLIFVYLYMMIMFVVVQFVIAPLFVHFVGKHVERQIGVYWRDIVSGFFHVIETDLTPLPVAQWDEAVKAMQPHFNFPITLAPMASTQLLESERLTLDRGEIAVKGDGELFRHQINDSGFILTMGPIPEFTYASFYIELLFFLIIAVFFSIFAFIWVLPYARKLKRIGSTAVAFGKGELNVRVEVPARSSLAPLAEAFNSMADRIQELISSHKELTHSVSHELRTPLARLRFSLEMLSSADNPAQRESHLDGMKSDINELDLLVSELLTYAKFDRENFQPRMELVDLALWLTDLTSVADAENAKVAVDCRIISPSRQVPALIDPRLLERAVRNLLQNAVRYADARIHVTLKIANGQCIIHVDDDGPGIPAADRQRIFEPFVRIEANEDRKSDGYGLGLAIVQRVAQWHNGSIAVSDAPIGGARFTLRWPFLSES
jgi:signal transduction histidine kinase